METIEATEIVNDQALTTRKPITEVERLRRQRFSKASVKHGQYKTPEYTAWLSMRQRCVNPKHPCYRLYGARGISVCPRWDSFENFLADMGKRPDSNHSLERMNNSRGYSPENCAWANHSAQMRNTRRNVLLTIRQKTQCLKDWCVELGKRYRTVISRIYRGWSPRRALLAPVQTQFRKKSYGNH